MSAFLLTCGHRGVGFDRSPVSRPVGGLGNNFSRYMYVLTRFLDRLCADSTRICASPKKITLPAFGGSDTLRIATLPLLPDGVRSFASAPVCAHGIARRRLHRLHHARIPARAQPSHGHHCSHANNNLSLKGVKQRLESSGWPSPTGRCICGRPGDAAGYAPPSPRSSAAQFVRWAAGYLMNP